MKNAIYPLAPYPLMVCAKRHQFSAAETEYIADLEMIENTGNMVSRNDRVLDNQALSEVRQFIEEQLFAFKKNLLRIKDENEIYITQSWVNRSNTDQLHPKHKHANSVISGVLFLDENSDSSLPPIRFHRTLDVFPVDFSYEELNEFNASCREFDPELGMLILFPSSVEHDVEKNTSERTRSSLSFNTYVRGTVGGKRQLTEVTIS